MVQRVIVGVNVGEGSLNALDWAVVRAGSIDSELELVAAEKFGWAPTGGIEVDCRTAYEQARFFRPQVRLGRMGKYVRTERCAPLTTLA